MKKLKLSDLKVKSFVTNITLENQRTVKGGRIPDTGIVACDAGGPGNTDNITCQSAVDACNTANTGCTNPEWC